MAAFPTYDPTTDTIRLNGNSVILLTLLMKSKFGERFDPETLFHSELSTLIDQLQAAAGLSKPRAGECFDRADLFTIAELVLSRSVHIGWWSMPDAEKRALLQAAAAPWVLSEEQLQTIMEDVGNQLFRHREVVVAADRSNECR
jgi:hypothetical protein